jgi:hypothetical protein
MGQKWIKKIYSQDFQDNIVRDYLAPLSIEKISQKYSITTRQVIRIPDDNQISHKPTRKVKLDEQYFDRYNNPTYASEILYWAGFIAADGNVMNKSSSRSYFLTVRLERGDENHLIKLRTCLSSDAKIKQEINKGGIRCGKIWKDSLDSVIVFHSKYLVNSLTTFNIIPAKSLIYTFPETITNSPYISDFIRGYLDGDGSISFKKEYLRINFYGTLSCLTRIGQIINQNCDISLHIPFKNRTIYDLEYNGKEAVLLIHWLYKNHTTNTYLDRKYDLIKYLIDT